jgi:hypothetical protein
MTYEAGQDFAARYWGGKDVTASPAPAARGPRDVDGGQVSYPAGWGFFADGFTYRVHEDDGVWVINASDGAFATFSLAGNTWIVLRGWTNSEVTEVPAVECR